MKQKRKYRVTDMQDRLGVPQGVPFFDRRARRIRGKLALHEHPDAARMRVRCTRGKPTRNALQQALINSGVIYIGQQPKRKRHMVKPTTSYTSIGEMLDARRFSQEVKS